MGKVRISSENFNSKSAGVTFYSINDPNNGIFIGDFLLPFTYENEDCYGTYELYIYDFDKTCTTYISPTPTPTPTGLDISCFINWNFETVNLNTTNIAIQGLSSGAYRVGISGAGPDQSIDLFGIDGSNYSFYGGETYANNFPFSIGETVLVLVGNSSYSQGPGDVAGTYRIISKTDSDPSSYNLTRWYLGCPINPTPTPTPTTTALAGTNSCFDYWTNQSNSYISNVSIEALGSGASRTGLTPPGENVIIFGIDENTRSFYGGETYANNIPFSIGESVTIYVGVRSYPEGPGDIAGTYRIISKIDSDPSSYNLTRWYLGCPFPTPTPTPTKLYDCSLSSWSFGSKGGGSDQKIEGLTSGAIRYSTGLTPNGDSNTFWLLGGAGFPKGANLTDAGSGVNYGGSLGPIGNDISFILNENVLVSGFGDEDGIYSIIAFSDYPKPDGGVWSNYDLVFGCAPTPTPTLSLTSTSTPTPTPTPTI